MSGSDPSINQHDDAGSIIAKLSKRLLNKERKFLFSLRVTEARLERYRQEYITAGMPEPKFVAIYSAISTAISVAKENVDILQGLDTYLQKNSQKNNPAGMQAVLELEKTRIKNIFDKFIAEPHITKLQEGLLLAADASWIAVILPMAVKEIDKLLAQESSKQYQVSDLDSILLPKVCKNIATHILDYLEIFTEIKSQGLELNLEALQVATSANNLAYAVKLENVDKINLDTAMIELTKLLQAPFYDRTKHREFKEKRNEVVEDIVIYIKNHHRELTGSKLEELVSIIIKLLAYNEIAKAKIKDIVFFSSFHKQFFESLKNKLQYGLDAKSFSALYDNIMQQIANKLNVRIVDLTGKAGNQAVANLAKNPKVCQ